MSFGFHPILVKLNYTVNRSFSEVDPIQGVPGRVSDKKLFLSFVFFSALVRSMQVDRGTMKCFSKSKCYPFAHIYEYSKCECIIL